jgi:hypothetical protein
VQRAKRGEAILRVQQHHDKLRRALRRGGLGSRLGLGLLRRAQPARLVLHAVDRLPERRWRGAVSARRR